MSPAPDPQPAYGPNEDAEYLDIFWGVRRVPEPCSVCGKPTRTPMWQEERFICTRCYYRTT